MPAQINVRAVACQVIDEVIHQHRSLSALMPSAQTQVEAKDQALLQELVFGICRWHFALRSHYQQWLHKPIPKRFQAAHTLLALGVYQLHFMRIPAHAALNETVSLAEALDLTPLKGMINAILRKSSNSDGDALRQQFQASHAPWLQQKLLHNWPEQAAAIFEANNSHPPMTLRVNKLKSSRAIYLDRLAKAGIDAQPCQYADQAIQLNKASPVESLPDFDSGAVSVQDEAAQLCTSLLDIEDSHRILDACAAPGGKTCAILEQGKQVELLALDSDAARAKRIEQNLKRLNLSCDIKVAEAELLDSWWDGRPFDRILVDAPCSATGVIRRHPDIKLLRREGDIKNLAELQLKMLGELWKTLASGGKLLYATCSVFPQENSRIIQRFLKQESSAELVPICADWGHDTGFGRQLFPQKDAHDGFFYACLRKVKADS